MYGIKVVFYDGPPGHPDTHSVSSYQDITKPLWEDKPARLFAAQQEVGRLLDAIDERGFVLNKPDRAGEIRQGMQAEADKIISDGNYGKEPGQ